MPFSPYTDQAFLNSLCGKTSNFGALGSVPSIYVGLSTTTPSVVGGSVTNITEPSGNGYARVSAPASDWGTSTEAAPAVIANGTALSFPTATGDWSSGSNMTYFVIFDSSTSGNCLGFAALTEAKPVLNGDTASFAIGALQLELE